MSAAILSFSVPGKPVPKARARTVNVGRKVRTFTPAGTEAYETMIRSSALRALRARQLAPAWSMLARYRVEIEVRRNDARGDLDNYIKSALDACNGILWRDDAQVVELRARRVPPGDAGEMLTMAIEAMEAEPAAAPARARRKVVVPGLRFT